MAPTGLIYYSTRHHYVLYPCCSSIQVYLVYTDPYSISIAAALMYPTDVKFTNTAIETYAWKTVFIFIRRSFPFDVHRD